MIVILCTDPNGKPYRIFCEVWVNVSFGTVVWFGNKRYELQGLRVVSSEDIGEVDPKSLTFNQEYLQKIIESMR